MVRLFVWSEMAKETWPLWMCLPDGKPCRKNNWQSIPNESLINLIQLQWECFGTKLDLLTDSYSGVETLKEIEELMKQRPRWKGKVWFDI